MSKRRLLAGPATVAVPAPPTVSSWSCNSVNRQNNCVMMQMLPNLLRDPDYGLNGVDNSSLAGLSFGDYNRIAREYNENTAAVDYCSQGATLIPTWTWYTVSAHILPVGYTPQNYTITLYASYLSLKIPVITSVGILNPGQDYLYTAIIPIRLDEVDKISTFELECIPQTS